MFRARKVLTLRRII